MQKHKRYNQEVKEQIGRKGVSYKDIYANSLRRPILGFLTGSRQLCRASTFHKAHRQITGSLVLGSHDGSIQ